MLGGSSSIIDLDNVPANNLLLSTKEVIVLTNVVVCVSIRYWFFSWYIGLLAKERVLAVVIVIVIVEHDRSFGVVVRAVVAIVRTEDVEISSFVLTLRGWC